MGKILTAVHFKAVAAVSGVHPALPLESVWHPESNASCVFDAGWSNEHAAATRGLSLPTWLCDFGVLVGAWSPCVSAYFPNFASFQWFCDLPWYCDILRNTYSVFIPSSRHWSPKTLGISWVIGVRGVSFVIHSKFFSTVLEFMLMKWFLEGGTQLPEETTMWLEGWNFQSPPVGRGKGLEIEFNDQRSII